MTRNTSNLPEPIDLGLPSGTLWASHNVGAYKPEESGDYFVLSATEDAETADSARKTGSAKDSDAKCKDFDSAAELIGQGWRMPTEEHLRELRDSCDWKWTTRGSAKGYEVRSRANSNSIFIPAAGYCHGHKKEDKDIAAPASDPDAIRNFFAKGSYGYLWSATADGGNGSCVRTLFFGSHGIGFFSKEAIEGLPIRAIKAQGAAAQDSVRMSAQKSAKTATPKAAQPAANPATDGSVSVPAAKLMSPAASGLDNIKHDDVHEHFCITEEGTILSVRADGSSVSLGTIDEQCNFTMPDGTQPICSEEALRQAVEEAMAELQNVAKERFQRALELNAQSCSPAIEPPVNGAAHEAFCITPDGEILSVRTNGSTVSLGTIDEQCNFTWPDGTLASRPTEQELKEICEYANDELAQALATLKDNPMGA